MKKPAKNISAAPSENRTRARQKAPVGALWSIESPPVPDDLLNRLAPATRPRGRPPSGKSSKVQVTLRLDADTLAAFKADGPGWQSRIDDTLRQAAVKLKGGR